MGTNNEQQEPSTAWGKPLGVLGRNVFRLMRGDVVGAGFRPVRGAFWIFYDAVMRFLQDDGWAISSYIALSILTSLFPFLIFVTALAGFFGTKGLADEVVRLLFQTWPQQVAAPIASEIHNVMTNTRGGVLTFGVVLALYFASSSVEAIRIGLTRAYDEKETRAWWLLRLESIAYVFVGALSLLTLALLIVFGQLLWSVVLHFAPHFESLATFVTFSRFGIASLVLLAALILAHKFLPAGRRSFAEMAPGILLTIVMWIAASIAFGSYLAEFARNYVTTYAGLASVMIALVFLYLIAAIFIFGGELNAAILRAKREKRGD
jgi:membrane protein